jgi:hypothetical protein
MWLLAELRKNVSGSKRPRREEGYQRKPGRPKPEPAERWRAENAEKVIRLIEGRNKISSWKRKSAVFLVEA